MFPQEAIDRALNPSALSVGTRVVRAQAAVQDRVVIIPPPTAREVEARNMLESEQSARRVLAEWCDKNPVTPGLEAAQQLLLRHENTIADLVTEIRNLTMIRQNAAFAEEQPFVPPPLPRGAQELLRSMTRPLIEEVSEETF